MKLRKIDKTRWILHFGRPYESRAVRLELSSRYNFGLGWNVTRDERDIQLSLYCFKIFSLWLTYEAKLKYRTEPLNTGFVWDPKQHTIKIDLLSQKMMDSSKPAVLDIYWNYHDWLFGQAIHSESRHGQSYHVKTLKMTLPEGDYEMKLDRYTSYWHRPRSPFVKSIERVKVTPTVPVGIPAKGESDYDQDEDATFSSTMPTKGRTDEQIVEDFKQDILDTREKRASRTWVPTRKWKQDVSA